MNQSFKLFGFEFTVTSFVAILVWVVSVTLQKFLMGSIDEVATAFTIITIQILNLVARFNEGAFDWKSSTFWMGVFGTLIMGVDVFATGASDILSGSVVIIIGSITSLAQMFGVKNFLKRNEK
jgi:hypothetical protein